jgi:hypothetical protein
VLDLGVRLRYGHVEVGLAVEKVTVVEWRSCEFFYASCAPGEVAPLDPDCPLAGGGSGFGDRHFTSGNPRNVRGSVRVHF